MAGHLEIKMGELFSGPGGIACGIKMAAESKELSGQVSVKHVWSNDFDSDTCDTYRHNIDIAKTAVICKDVRKLQISELPPINALAFGFPCNDYSVVGEKKGMSGTYGPLYSYGVKTLIEKQPLWFFAENVSGLRNSNDGKDFEKILKEMFDAGYDLFPNLYCFEEYGIPQARHRIIIIGIRKDLKKKFMIPAPSHVICTCKDALENPPIPEDAPNNEKTVQNPIVVKRLSYIKPGENAFTADLPDDLKLNIKGAKISQIYRRLDPQKPAYTLTGSGGGGTHMYHWSEPRALTNRERARIQTFPDDFVFLGNKESVRKQIGMAVPPQGAKIIFEAVFKTLLDTPYDSVEASMTPMVHESD
ncbi:DNA cytosine methyltransferase [Methanomethylophilus alvi]|uniref:DNA cytosine methyltransferase n=1 Tax=Methanomethylophilus alvi TaxID=1291540 RepID=UPI0037DD2A9A